MSATTRAILVRAVEKKWRKLRRSMTKEVAPRHGWTPKALSNVTLRSLLATGAPPHPFKGY